ncbi:MAG: hypothetical protein K0S53_408 [Bacteroidetes bacterium]|jgi:hypothetical protein|nr:hypothetical protein [Bacteroidota bacterium]
MANKTYINKNIKSLIDLTVELYGDVRYAFKLIDDNVFLTGIQDTIEVGVEIIFDDVLLSYPARVFKTVTDSYINKNIKSLIDLTVELYGDTSYVFKMIEDNSSFTGIHDEVPVGMQISYDESIIKQAKTAKKKPVSSEEISGFSTVTIGTNQSIYDMAIQMYGQIEAIFSIISDNSVIDNINNNNLVGLKMKYTPQTFAITEYFKTNSIKITTGIAHGRAFDNSFDLSFN